MRLGIKSSLLGVSGKMVRVLALLLMCVIARGAMAQGTVPAPPYVLPYTMTTLVGGSPYRAGNGSAPYNQYPQPCSTGLSALPAWNGTNIAFDNRGDGCPGYQENAGGGDIHDIYVDGFGAVYWADGPVVYRRYDPHSGTATVYAGTANGDASVNSLGPELTACPNADKYGDGCQASDNLGNWTSDCTETAFSKTSVPTFTPCSYPYIVGNAWEGYSGQSGAIGARGLSVAPNEDFLLAAYSQSAVFRVGFTTDLMNQIAGKAGSGGFVDGVLATNGEMDQDRGVAEDGLGNVWIADTGGDAVREVPGPGAAGAGNIYIVGGSGNPTSFPQTPGCVAGKASKGVNTGTTTFNAPEGIRVDPWGNVYALGSNITALYEGTGTLVDVPTSSLQTGYWYTVIGVTGASSCQMVAAGGTGTSPKTPNTQTPGNNFVSGASRKFAIDSHGNLYLPSNSGNYIWFVDHVTGYARLIAGQTGTGNSTCTASTNQVPANLGDGCPAVANGVFAFSSDANVAADAFGNIYIGDPEGSATSTATSYVLGTADSRIREVVSGLDFTKTLNAQGAQVPTAIPLNAPGPNPTNVLTQTIEVHVNPTACPNLYSPCTPEAGATTFAISPANADFKILNLANLGVGGSAILSETLPTNPTPTNQDGSIDYLVKVQFAPTKPGMDTATLVVTTASGLKSNLSLVGTGGGASVAIDPGAVTTVGPTPSPFVHPAGVFADSNGNYYIADPGANEVFLDNGGTVTVIAGNGTAGYNSADDGALATAAELNGPTAVTADAAGNVYIADTGNNRIRRVEASTGIITTYAGGGTAGSFCPTSTDTFGDSCPAAATTYAGQSIGGAILNHPSGVAIDLFGNLFISDTGDNLIRRVGSRSNAASAAPFIFNFAGGTATCANATDGFGDGCTVTGGNNVYVTGLTFNAPEGLALDATSSNLYVADTGNSSVRKINIATTLGTAVTSARQVSAPTGVALDAAGNVYIADTGNGDISVIPASTITPTGSATINTILGYFGYSGNAQAISTNPTATQIQLGSSVYGGVAVTPAGQLVASDPGNGRVLLDDRTSAVYNFGVVSSNSTLLPYSFTQLSTGTLPAALSSFTSSATTPPWSLGPASTNGCSSSSLAPGTFCGLSAQFTPTTVLGQGPQNAQFTENLGTTASATPNITLSATGVNQLATTTTYVQTTPATGDPSYGIPLVVLATVQGSPTPAAPAPTGNVVLDIDGVRSAAVALVPGITSSTASLTAPAKLAVGTHSIVVEYFGQGTTGTYSASTSAPQTFTVTPPLTTSTMDAIPTEPQFSTLIYSASVVAIPAGIAIPTGKVEFVATQGTSAPVLLNVANLSTVAGSSTTAKAIFTQSLVLNSNSTVNTETLQPGSYTINAYYNCVGLPASIPCPSTDSGFIGSAASQPLTVQPQTVVAGTNPPAALLLTSKPCNAANTLLINSGIGATVLPLFTCANDPGYPSTSVAVGAPNTLTGGIATPNGVSTGSPGGTMTSVTLCPYSQTVSTSNATPATNYQTVLLSLPIVTTPGGNCSGSLDPHNYTEAAVFTEPNSFTPGETVMVTGATTGTPNNAQIYNVEYQVIAATSTTWAGVLTSYVATGQGASIDATIFILPANTLSGTLSYSCAGLPANAACTFNPTSITLTANAANPTLNKSAYIPLTVTFFTDLQPGETNGQSSSLRAPGIQGHRSSGMTLALLLGWPVTLLGLAGLIRFRKRKGLASSFTLTALLLMALGSSVLFTAGCGGGPGAYKVNATPTGVYPVVVTVTNGTPAGTQSIVIDLAVFPGVTGSE